MDSAYNKNRNNWLHLRSLESLVDNIMVNLLLLLLLCLSPLLGQGTVDLPESLADPSAEIEPVKVGLAYSEGPVVDSMGNVYFSEDPDVKTGRIWKITPDGDESVFFDSANGSNGMEFDPQGRLVSCQNDRLARFGPSGEPDFFVTNDNTGFDLGRVNDLTIGSEGGIYFTNLGGGEIFFRSPEGEVKEFKMFNASNGIEWIEEDTIIFIAASGLQKCKVESNNDITGCEQFISHQVDGLTLDELGNLYTADWGAGQVKVHSPDGTQIGSIAVDAQETSGNESSGERGNTSNCIFGGPERKTLYITGDGGLYKVEMKVAGRAPEWWPEYMKGPDTLSAIRLPKYVDAQNISRFIPTDSETPAKGYRNILGKSQHSVRRVPAGWLFINR